MTIGVNDQDALGLASLLRTQQVQARNVRVGDIVVDDHAVWQVTATGYDDDYLVLSEVDGNDTHYPPHLQRSKVTIIARSCRRTRRK